MSKINYRDKIILLSFLVIAIWVLGIIFLIKPKNEELKANKSEYTTKKNQLESLEKQVDQIYEVQEHIVLTHADSTDKAASFSDIRHNDELDEYVESTLLNLGLNEKGDQIGLKVSNTIAYGEANTSTLTYYYYTPSILTYPIYTAADLNGDFETESAEALAKSASISARAAQTIVSSTVTLAYEGTESEVLQFLDLVADSDEKVLLNSIDISSVLQTYVRAGTQLVEDEATITGSLTFQFYSAQAPDLLYKDLFEETSDGKSDALKELVEKNASSFKEKAEAAQ